MKKPSIIIQLVEQNMLQSVHSWLFRQILNLTAEMNLQIFSQTKHLFTYQHALQQFMVISIIKNVNTFYFLLMPLAQKKNIYTYVPTLNSKIAQGRPCGVCYLYSDQEKPK